MALYAIGDLHLSLAADKPMDIFPGWEGYVQKLEADWRARVTEKDTIVLAGDSSWAMKLEDCDADFAFINSMPGQKLIIKGNHDYWWSTMAKMNAYTEKMGFSTISFLFNNAYSRNGFAICGTRSWLFNAEAEHDEKVMARELGRLEASLKAAKALPGEDEIITFLHYPPVTRDARAQDVLELLAQYGVRRCYYGHLHGHAIRRAVNGAVDGIECRLISADALGFKLTKITHNSMS